MSGHRNPAGMGRTVRVLALSAALAGCLASTARAQAARDSAQARMRSAEATLLFVRDQDAPGARQAYLDALRLDPEYAQPRYNLGILAEREQDWAEAKRWFQEFLRYDGSSRYSLLARAKLAYIEQELTRGATAEGRTEREYLDRVGRSRFRLAEGRPAEAYAEAARASSLLPQRHEAYVAGAAALAQTGAYADAAEFARKALERASGSDREALQGVVEQLRRREQIDRLVAEATDLMSRRNYDAAAQKYVDARAISPERADIGLRAAAALALAGNQAGAEAILVELTTSAEPTIAREALLTLMRMRELRSTSDG